MAKVIDESLLLNTYDPFDDQRQRQKIKEKRKKRRLKKKVLTVFILLIFVFFILFIYFLTDASKVKSIRIEHDRYLTDDYILSIANIDYDSRYWLVFSPFVEFILERDLYIKHADVRHTSDHTIVIDVEEEIVTGYFWDEKDQCKLLMGDGKIKTVSKNYQGVLKSIPYLKNATTELNLEGLAKSLSQLDYKILSNIVEVWHYTTSYDDKMVRLLMVDGHQVFSSVEALVLLQSYNDITENLKKTSCLVLDLNQNIAYTQSCDELNQVEAETIQANLMKNEANDDENIENNGEEVGQ